MPGAGIVMVALHRGAFAGDDGHGDALARARVAAEEAFDWWRASPASVHIEALPPSELVTPEPRARPVRPRARVRRACRSMVLRDHRCRARGTASPGVRAVRGPHTCLLAQALPWRLRGRAGRPTPRPKNRSRRRTPPGVRQTRAARDRDDSARSTSSSLPKRNETPREMFLNSTASAASAPSATAR